MNKVDVPNMQIPCDECLNDSQRTISNKEFITVYCPHRQAGAIRDLREGVMKNMWRIMTPIDEATFTNFITVRTEMATAKTTEIKKRCNA